MTLGVATAGPFLINVTLPLNIFFFSITRAGLAEEVTGELPKVAGMKVASRKSKDQAVQCISKLIQEHMTQQMMHTQAMPG